ncbi:EAL domain-containing protein [Klebsiella variicola]|nr:EAL domain-containing protein [Klebsiella variicola]
MKSESFTEERIALALKNDEFKPYIQPIVSSKDLSISGGELLLRWCLKDGRIISAKYFIDLAESAGILSLITRKLMREAIMEISKMKSSLGDEFFLSANLTPTLLIDKYFIEECLSIMAESNIQLILELTEHHPFYLNKKTEEAFNILNRAGVKFALDDFGTGNSVISYLNDFPIHYIKIDKAFTRNIFWDKSSYHITKFIVNLAKNFGIKTVAEGAERLGQICKLNSIGVDYFQGFYFGKPEILHEFCSDHYHSIEHISAYSDRF